MSKKKNLRRLSTLVTAQTLGNLEKLAAMPDMGTPAGSLISWCGIT